MSCIRVRAFVLVCFCVSFVSAAYIHAMNNEEYEIIRKLVQNSGQFSIPPSERNKAHRSAYVKYWRIKEKLSLDGNGILLFEGKRVLKKGEVKRCVSKTFEKSKSGGYKKLLTRGLDGYAGLSRRNILQVTSNDADLKKFTVKFTNKAVPRPIIAKEIHEIHQLDLVDMKSQQVEYQGKRYRYVLSLLDVFSRFHWLAPLTSKHSSKVAVELKKIYCMHGTPKTLQSDRGKEFYGAVKRFCENRKIRVIKSRAYHPQSQGKVERSHRTLRKKLNFDLIKQGKKGLNWARNLQEYAKCLNNDKREELGWRSAFDVYFGRKSNELVKCGISVQKQKGLVAIPVIPPSVSDINKHQRHIDQQKEKVQSVNKRICDRTMRYFKKKNKCSRYTKGEEVFVRYGKKRKGRKAPKQRYVILGEIMKIGKNENTYKVEFINPISHVLTSEWFSVEDIANFKKTIKKKTIKENGINKKKQYQENLLKPLTKNEGIELFSEQGYSLTYDPPSDGNCQFHAIAQALTHFGVYRSAQTLREEIVSYLQENEYDDEGFPLELFAAMPFSDYLTVMSRDGTYGDQLTLRAASELYNVDFTIVSTLGVHGGVRISPNTQNSFGTIVLGHFAEGNGDHYVLLDESGTSEFEENADAKDNKTQEKSSEENVDFSVEGTKESNTGQEKENISALPERSKRSRKIPTRLRHSIGSPSLSLAPVKGGRSATFDDLPPEIVEKVLRAVLVNCNYDWPNHVVSVYQSLRNVCGFWKIICDSDRILSILPRVYVPYQEILPKAKADRSIQVNMQRIIKNAGSFSGLAIELKTILNNKQWNTAWLVLRLLSFGWYLIQNIRWIKKH